MELFLKGKIYWMKTKGERMNWISAVWDNAFANEKYLSSEILIF